MLVPGYECDYSPVAPTDFDLLISGYGLSQTALVRGPYSGANLISVAEMTPSLTFSRFLVTLTCLLPFAFNKKKKS